MQVAWESGIGGGLVFSKVDERRADCWGPRPPVVRAGLLLLVSACVSLSACTAGRSPMDPGSPSPAISTPVASKPSMPGSQAPNTPQPSPSESAPLPSAAVTAGDPNDVPPDNTDYSKDVGNTPRQYEYEPEPEPPKSVIATLCNLNQVFFRGLRSTKAGEGLADSTLRTSMVALDDLMDYWETLRVHYPDATADIDLAVAVHEQWKIALVNQDNADQRGTQKAMAAAEDLIRKLPEVDAVGCRR